MEKGKVNDEELYDDKQHAKLDVPKPVGSHDSLPSLGASPLSRATSGRGTFAFKPQAASEAVGVYISKRPFGDECLLEGYKFILDFLLHNTTVEYHVFLENSVKSHSVDEILPSFNIKFVFTIGGDGTILWAHNLFNTEELPPFICFNGGTLCFLSNFNINDHKSVMQHFHEKVISGVPFKTQVYPRLNAYVCGADECQTFKRYALNDVVIERSTPSIIVLELFINGSFAVKIQSDGLLVSSSTGSTAYNLSLANGIIMHSDVECILINPMASMSLSSRPVVVPKDAQVKIVFSAESRHDSRLVYDGLANCVFKKGDYLIIETASKGLSMIVPDEYQEFSHWIMKLRELRGWK